MFSNIRFSQDKNQIFCHRMGKAERIIKQIPLHIFVITLLRLLENNSHNACLIHTIDQKFYNAYKDQKVK